MFEPFFDEGHRQGHRSRPSDGSGIVKTAPGWIGSLEGRSGTDRVNLDRRDRGDPVVSGERPADADAAHAVFPTPAAETADHPAGGRRVDDPRSGPGGSDRSGFRVLTAATGRKQRSVRRQPNVRSGDSGCDDAAMSGRDAFRLITEMNPSARILFSTGLGGDLAEVTVPRPVEQPYRPQELLEAVRPALATTRSPPGDEVF